MLTIGAAGRGGSVFSRGRRRVRAMLDPFKLDELRTNEVDTEFGPTVLWSVIDNPLTPMSTVTTLLCLKRRRRIRGARFRISNQDRVTQIFASWNQTVCWLRCVNSLRHVAWALQTESGGQGANGRCGTPIEGCAGALGSAICESRRFFRVWLCRWSCCATHSRTHSCPSGLIRRPTRCGG